jgi:plasmid maintenance system antidote protein VapI
MSTILSSKSIRAIEKGIRAGRCLTVIPDRKGAAMVVESDEFLTAEESAAFLKSIAHPTPGTYLDMFIWERQSGSVKRFAAKVGYHPNRISALKSASDGISARLFRRMAEAYKLTKKEREFWGKRLLGI